MKKLLILVSAVITVIFSMTARELPKAYLKAQYQEWYKYYNSGDTVNARTGTGLYVLQIADGMSYYYDPQTYRIDSLENTVEGKAMLDEVEKKLMQDFIDGGSDPFLKKREMGLTRGKYYRARKDFGTGIITVWDSDMGDKHRYEVEMADLVWQPGDSTRTIMGYECASATADYHGRKWEAWFAPELAVQDGPWQLCGLPGLILEANTSDGEYGFSVTGLQKCDEQLKNPYENDKYYRSKRKGFLKTKAYGRQNRAARISAMTGGKVKITAEKSGKVVDLIETDYK